MRRGAAGAEGVLDAGTWQTTEGEGGLAAGGQVRVVQQRDERPAEFLVPREQRQAPQQPRQSPASRWGSLDQALLDQGRHRRAPEQGALDQGGLSLVRGREKIKQGREVAATRGEAWILEQGGEGGHGACKVVLFEYVAAPTSGGSPANPQQRVRFFIAISRSTYTVPYLYSADPNLQIEALQAVLSPVLIEQGVGLVELQFRRERPGWVLRVTIENPEGQDPGAGITLDRCADVSRAISAALDATDQIQPAYTLEVTSPGVERPLHGAADFRRFEGLMAKFVLRTPVSEGPLKGQSALVGRLRGADEGGGALLEVAIRGGVHRQALPTGDLKLAHLVYAPAAGATRGRAPAKGSKPAPSGGRSARKKNSELRMATQNTETNLGFIIEQVAKEKGIDKTVLTKTVEEAIRKAALNIFGDTREFEARFNESTGQLDLLLYMLVVEDEEVDRPEREISIDEVRKRGLEAELGEELGFPVYWHPSDAKLAKEQDEAFGDLLGLKQARSTFGRIAAQTAKQVLLTGIREAERDLIYNEFKDREGKLIKGIVRRFEKGNNIVVDLGKTEGILISKEQTPRESYRPNDRIVALVKHVDREGKGPPVVLSRQDPRLVEKLFEAEVPEIYDGIVRIVSVAREAGARSKIAVASHHSDVDPVGACVGMKGSRVQAVVQELRGEKVDIVPFDHDPAKFVINAVQPAEVTKVIVDDSDHRMELVVSDEKLSLAIGRKGQNVRLASQLTGWKLDIISETRFRQLEEESLRGLQQIDGLHEDMARALYRAGFRSPEELADADPDELASTGVVDDAGAAALHASAVEHLEAVRQRRLQAARGKNEALSDREKLALIPGIGDHTVELLIEAGYHTPEGVAREEETRLAYRVGLNENKAALLRAAAQQLLDTDWKTIDAVRLMRRASPGVR
jgi:N utilization substance protein A